MDLLCKMPYFPTAVITDQGQNEINAIQHAFDFKPRTFYCAWYILQAWERNFTIENLGSRDLKTEERKARRDRASKAFLTWLLMALSNNIVYCRDPHTGLMLESIIKGVVST